MAQGGNLTTAAANEILDHLLSVGSYTMPVGCFLALFDVDPGDAMGSGTEHLGDGYARQSVTFGAAAGRACANTDAPSFTAAGGDWGSTIGWAIYDAVTAGNAIWHGEFDEAEVINDGNTFTVAIGDIDIDMAASA